MNNQKDLVKKLYNISNSNTQSDFADKVNEEQSTVNAILRDKRKISLQKFIDWCDFINVKITLK